MVTGTAYPRNSTKPNNLDKNPWADQETTFKNTRDLNTHAILGQLIKGNQLAFKQLYDLHVREVFNLAIHILKETKYAEEIVQDTFMEIWKHRERIDVEGNIATYLYVICRNKSFNKLKELKRRHALFDSLTDYSNEKGFLQEDIQEAQDLKEILELIIDRLPPRQQAIFRLCRLEGFAHKEVAEQLGISVQTVKNQMVTALRFVREELSKYSKNSPYSLVAVFFLSYFSAI